MTAAVLPATPTVRLVAWVRESRPALALASVVLVILLMTPNVSGAWASADGALGWTVSSVFLYPFPAVAGTMVVAGVLLGRRHPVLASTLTMLPFLLVPWNGGWFWGWWLGALAVAVLAVLDGLWRAAVPVLASVLVVVVYCGTETPAFLPIGAVTSGTGAEYETSTLVVYLLAIFVSVGVAAAIGVGRRSRSREARALVVERHALEVESLAGERARLARDLHDVVAHHVSLVAVRAESAPFVHPGLDEDARAVLAAIAVDAREALTELRQVLVVLQRTGADAERAPQPTACDVDGLVASAVAAGHPVAVEGAWVDVAPGPGYVLYRAVQEGLTNARRHAPGAATVLVRTQQDGSAGFRLTNPASSAGEPARGLLGMRERVEALGGTLTSGVVDGTFVLEVAVPARAGASSGPGSARDSAPPVPSQAASSLMPDPVVAPAPPRGRVSDQGRA